MINKDVLKSLARKNGNEIIIWSWNNPIHETNRSVNQFYRYHNIGTGKQKFGSSKD